MHLPFTLGLVPAQSTAIRFTGTARFGATCTLRSRVVAEPVQVLAAVAPELASAAGLCRDSNQVPAPPSPASSTMTTMANTECFGGAPVAA